ncbi:rRNA maturation RNase YbeY, partial [Ureaplasma urealyticum]
GHSFERELCFLFTHGLLHLLGYDHIEVEEEKIMFGLQDEILNELNITRNVNGNKNG